MIVLGWWDESSGKNTCCTILTTRVQFPITLVERESPLWRCSLISTSSVAWIHLQSYTIHTHKKKHTHICLHMCQITTTSEIKNLNVVLFKEFMKHEQGFFYSALVARTEEITFCIYEQKSILETLQTSVRTCSFQILVQSTNTLTLFYWNCTLAASIG